MDKSQNLYDAIKAYSRGGSLPMHMPGHKRNTSLLGGDLPYNIDFTEINGLDNLHNPTGIIKNAQEKAAALYDCDKAFLLVNGSTCGILAAVHSTVRYGGDVIMARGSHKSVYNAVALRGAKAHYIYPPTDNLTGVCASVTPDSVEEAFHECPQAQTVIVTSPTYEGVISDISAIANIAHSHGVPLIVDGAHGAHLRFVYGTDYFDGADIVIMSLHKTLPALTQTAVAVLNGGLVSSEDFAAALGIFETSSPSYILMASADRCLDFIYNNGTEMFLNYNNLIKSFSEDMRGLKHLSVLCMGSDSLKNHNFFAYDFGKITVCTGGTNISGIQLMDLLRERYSIELEMAYPNYALAMTSVCDSKESMSRLSNALLEIDKELHSAHTSTFPSTVPRLEKSQSVYTSHRGGSKNSHSLTVGEPAGYCVYAYPPGIPIALSDETVSAELVEYIDKLTKSGVDVIFA